MLAPRRYSLTGRYLGRTLPEPFSFLRDTGGLAQGLRRNEYRTRRARLKARRGRGVYRELSNSGSDTGSFTEGRTSRIAYEYADPRGPLVQVPFLTTIAAVVIGV